MNITVGLFTDKDSANKAVKALSDSGHASSISIIAKESNHDYLDTSINKVVKVDDQVVEDGAVTGAVLATIASLLVGTAAYSLPGGIVVIGAIASGLIGLAGGATIATLVEIFSNSGLSSDKVKILTDRLAEGDIILSVKSEDEELTQATKILKEYGAKTIEEYA